jgi:uncharacterized protein YgfB (UPF0149 family)
MIYKYWVEFDEEGDIKALYKNKYDCKSECKEFIVKLTPIDRGAKLVDAVDGLHKEVEGFSKGLKTLTKESKKMSTEFEKVVKRIKKI